MEKSLEAKAAEFLLKPYARIILPEEDGSYRGEIMEFPGCFSIGDSASEALDSLERVAESWLMASLEKGQNIPVPIESNSDFSGKLVLRFPKSLHKQATWIAEREGVSLNQLIVTSLAIAVGARHVFHSLNSGTTIVFSNTNIFTGFSIPNHHSMNKWFETKPTSQTILRSENA
jgi:predicted HicB family RNase H-like nuclease